MSDSSSLFSCNSSDSDLHDELSSGSSFKCSSSNTSHLLRSLYNREIGSSQFKPSFLNVPDRLKFPLHTTLPTSSLSSHVFLGLSKCGQLLITYTYSTDMDDRPMSFNTIYKYRLHWWAFVPYSQARKVAEVTLFGNHNVYCPLYLAVCQWPTDPSKILVYGNCNETFVGLVGQTERSYVTITAVPSLHNCFECQKVAASFEEEDIAASWDTCVRFSCLVHGLTVHTSFDVASPYPKFQPTISMKSSGRVVLNTGNFLHIIRVDLENTYKGVRGSKSQGEICQSQPDHFVVRTRSLATSNVNVRISEYQALLGFAPSSPFASSSDHTSCDSRSLVEELNITCQGYIGSSTNLSVNCRPDLLMLETDSDASSQKSSILSPPLKRRNFHLLSPSTSSRGQQGRHNSKPDAGKAYEFVEKDEKIYETLSSFRKRCLADKKYEFSEEDFEDSENIVPFRLIRHSENTIMRSPTLPLPPSPLVYPARERNASRTASSLNEPPDILTNYWRKSGLESGSVTPDGESSEVHSSCSIYTELSIDQDKVVLRPQNRNHALLSPREQEIKDASKENNKKAVQVHLDNNSLALPSGLSTSPHPFRSHSERLNANTAISGPHAIVSNVSTCTNKGSVAPTHSFEHDVTWPKGGCTVQFERRFIEVDDELVSVITDIEDDDESGSTGYHSALPLEVHGSGYVQMQMISNSKAEKLMAPCALIHQMSFDIEQFCHEVAEILCEKSGMKFWYCNNYDVEIIDVCPHSGDVMCLAFLKIKATVKSKGAPKSERVLGDRQQYETSCLLVWNMYSGMYRVERSAPLERLENSSADVTEAADISTLYLAPDSPELVDDWNPARNVAHELRLKSKLHFTATNQPPVRVLTNAPALKGTSLLEIKDSENGISFIL